MLAGLPVSSFLSCHLPPPSHLPYFFVYISIGSGGESEIKHFLGLMNDFKMNFIKFLKTVSEKAEKLTCVPVYVCIRTCVVCLLTNIRGIAELSS